MAWAGERVATARLLGLRPDAQLLLPAPNGNGGAQARRQPWGCSWWEQEGRRTEGTPGKGMDLGSHWHNQLCVSARGWTFSSFTLGSRRGKEPRQPLLLDHGRGCWGTPGRCAARAPLGFYEEVDFTSALLRGARCQPGRGFPSGVEGDDRQQLHGLPGPCASLGASGPLGAPSGCGGPARAGCRQRQGEGGGGSPATREQKWLRWVSATGRVFRKSGFVVEDKRAEVAAVYSWLCSRLAMATLLALSEPHYPCQAGDSDYNCANSFQSVITCQRSFPGSHLRRNRAVPPEHLCSTCVCSQGDSALGPCRFPAERGT